MPLSYGPVTCRPYYLTDPPPRDFLDQGIRDLKRHAFRPPQPERGQGRAIGWVNARNVLDAALTAEKVLFGEHLVLGLRIDKIGINQRLLKAHYAQALEQVLKERGRKTLHKEERAALMEKVRLEMMARQTPATSLYEMAWDLKSHHVFFSATGEALNIEFCDLFSDTFHTALTPLYPFLRARAKAEKEGLAEHLFEMEAARLSPGGVQTPASREE